MNLGVLIRILICAFVAGFFLYAYISKQNTITQLRLEIPSTFQQLKAITQENTRLQFEIDQFENPTYLLELSKRPEYSHLKYPLVHEVQLLEDL